MSASVKIGFVDSPNVLVLQVNDSAQTLADIESALRNKESVVGVDGAKGQRYVVVLNKVSYLASDEKDTRHVGFVS